MKKICFCCTVPDTFAFSSEIFKKISKTKYDVSLISSNQEKLENIANRYNFSYQMIPFKRSMSLFSDMACLCKLWRYFIKIKPHIVVGATPKAALISMIASFFAFVPIRIYHIYGLPFETAKGKSLKLLLFIEKITGLFSNHILPIGASVMSVVKEMHLYNDKKIQLPNLLTIGGVDLSKFDLSKCSQQKNIVRNSLGIPQENLVIGYVARLTYDKGFLDLIKIWNRIKEIHKNISLLVIGEIDERVPIEGEIVEAFLNQQDVFHISFTNEIERYFAIMNIFVFPSYREGFGNVIIEASAMKIPVVTYDVTGCRDAVKDGYTGYTLPFQDYDAVVNKISSLINNSALRTELGENGYIYVSNNFTSEIIADNFIKYLNLLN